MDAEFCMVSAKLRLGRLLAGGTARSPEQKRPLEVRCRGLLKLGLLADDTRQRPERLHDGRRIPLLQQTR
jgi:hypothetical protein